ncbi:MAG TPA: MerC domain-containing protein [Chitinophagaceae bacterium]|nr:MerC domain-containing protein [Chitinophagaceae bacterium]
MKSKVNWDVLGISASLACAIHCALLPLFLTSLPIFGYEIIENEFFEYIMIFLAFLIGCISLWHGYRKHHHSLRPLGIFGVGMALLLAKQIWHSYQFWILPLAVLFIVAAHLLNYRSCRIHNHAHADDCDH